MIDVIQILKMFSTKMYPSQLAHSLDVQMIVPQYL